MTRRTLGALLILTLAAGGAACSRVRPPATAPGLTASDSTTHPASSTEVVQGTPPAPAKQGNAQSPPDSSEPATEINPKGETLLPPLGFRPALLLLMYESGSGKPAEVYGYDLTTRQLGRLTQGGPGDAAEITPAPDGEMFAYVRTEAAGIDAAGLCTRPVQGGVPVCRWDRAGRSLAWRPGTRDLYVRGNSGLFAVRADTKGLSSITVPPGLLDIGGFSPDGRWLTYNDKGLVLLPLEAGRQRVHVDGVMERGGVWIAPDKLVVLHNELENRTSELLTVGLDGKVTPFPVMTPPPSWIDEVMADSTGRYVAINYGMQGAVYAHDGAAIYSLAGKQWREVKVGNEPAWADDWAAQGRLLLHHGEQYTLHDPENGKQTPLPVQLNGRDFTGRSPDGDWLAFENEGRRELRLYQVSTSELRSVDLKGLKILTTVWVPQAKPQQ